MPINPVADLYALAEVLATELAGPVHVTDPGLTVLAYSQGDDTAAVRNRWILSRTPPVGYRLRLRRLDQGPLDGSEDIARIDGPDGCRWAVVAIREATQLRGFLWVLRSDELTEAQRQRCVRAARAASPLLADRGRTEEKDDREQRSEHLRSALLEPGDGTDRLVRAAQLGLTQPGRLLAFEPEGDRARPAGDPRPEAELVIRALAAVMPQSAVTRIGNRTYVWVPGAADVLPAARNVLAETGRHNRQQMRCVVSGLVEQLTELPRAKAELDRLLGILQVTGRTRLAVLDDFRAHTVIAELAELAAQRPGLLRGAVERLRDNDETRGTSYIATLRAFFECSGDLGPAARRLYVHRNTLRYRLARIREISGLNIDEPIERLVAELQLRLADLLQLAGPGRTLSALTVDNGLARVEARTGRAAEDVEEETEE